YGFTICRGRAEFANAETLLCDGEKVSAPSYLIATGASPAVPPIPGLRDAGYLTSTTALELREPPRELVVIGANAVGLEMGQLFMRLGARVTFLDVAPRITPFEEPEVSDAMRAILEEEGGAVVTGASISSVVADGAGRLVTFEAAGSEHRISADQVLIATGRRPNTADLGLEKAGVEVTERGAVLVDDGLRTSNPPGLGGRRCDRPPTVRVRRGLRGQPGGAQRDHRGGSQNRLPGAAPRDLHRPHCGRGRAHR
ncbi:MAG TPA: FAD-dependent oxidoreductase, partial [Candidatus Dormibacteraeota bacterium]|nr:FAD-dependent oxidoreductase [Candidatus Dormibacteraeota bacterium]